MYTLWIFNIDPENNKSRVDTNLPSRYEKLDDGWPESVEEQSLLLLLVWRHYITRQYIKNV